MKLSDLLRYSVYDVKETFVPLTDELAYINNYIDFEKIRIGDRLDLSIDIENVVRTDIKIAPMLLIVFIENAFKHGVNPEQDSQIDIRISISEAAVDLLVRNNKVEINNKENSMGIGVDNSRQRLMRLYPQKHKLTIENKPDYYLVTLYLELS